MNDTYETSNTIAPITTVKSCLDALGQAMSRPDHLPGMVALYGPSGVGKSVAAAFCANNKNAYYIQLASGWAKKKFLESVLKEMSIKPEKTIGDMLDQICEELVCSMRPLIIDEADYAVDKKMLDLIRDIYEGSNAAILLIGEEHLSNKILRQSERFHNRMLMWAKAGAATFTDAKALRNYYDKRANVKIADDLLKHILNVTRGCVRRLCVNFEKVYTEAKRQGWAEVDRATWGDRELYDGKPGGRR